jgi:hypothetical protein
VPIAMPPLLLLGADPVWLSILTAINLQTAFLHPPFGFAIIFLRGVAPKEIPTSAIYLGVIPFVLIQLAVLALVWSNPRVVTALRERSSGSSAQSTYAEAGPGAGGEIWYRHSRNRLTGAADGSLHSRVP